MSKLRLTLITAGGVIILIIISFLVIGSLKPKFAGIYVETLPSASVWIGGVKAGQTPYRSTVKPGETIIRLIPEAFADSLLPYETKVNLIPGVETVVRYDFGSNEESSAGDIISFEKNIRGETSLVAVSIPDSASLVIDSRERAFTPHKTSSIAPGEHQLRFSAQGYNDRLVKVKIHEGYKLTAIVKLSKAKESTNTIETPSPTPVITQDRDEVEILSTDVGYVRVRSQPSSTSDEIGRVEPGKRYPLLEKDSKSGWYRIEYETGKSGWVSNQYTRRISNISPSVSPVPQASTSARTTSTPAPQASQTVQPQ